MHLPAETHLKELFEKQVEALRRGADARRTAQANVRFAYDLACEVEHDDRSLRVDLPASEGGTATGAHPGQLLRASLGACLLMGYRAWSARLGVPLEDARVIVSCEYDVRGQLGMDPLIFAGWERVVFDVTIWSSAPRGEVLSLLDTAHRTSPMLANLSPRVARILRVNVVARGDSAEERFVPHEVTPSR
jgi:uncharacterized OsmC-like protein